ncbi:MAG: 2-oxoglutarate and iron-dependent oxygenase domain-containing protein, partial [Hyphomicrobiales bacterium]|nr:2-oxoglutarate and iron-dependent oxygenase domain-containing protein [Hyphomicrobiales bacterium]
MTDVPIIDFLPFREGAAAGKAKVAREIRGACEGSGFFYLAQHGVPRAEVDAVFDASKRFFALPLEERMKVKLSPKQNRGYQPLGSRLYA